MKIQLELKLAYSIKRNIVIGALLLQSLFLVSCNNMSREKRDIMEMPYIEYEKSGYVRKFFDKDFNLVHYLNKAWYYRDAYYSDGKICVDSLTRDYYMFSKKLQFEGHLKSESPDIPVGKCVWYYENGNISSESFHDNDGLIQGISVSYYKDGCKEREVFYVNDNIEGKFINYYHNGKIRYESNFKNNEPDGLFIFYHENGKKKGVMKYKNGNLIEDYIMYFPNGMVKSVVKYNEEKKTGIGKFFYESGKIKETITYKNDVHSGECKTYYENGRLKSKGQIKNEKKTGKWEYYDLDGNVSYRNESLVFQRTYISDNSKSRNDNSSLFSECEELSEILSEADIDHEEPSSSMDYHYLQDLLDEYKSLLDDNDIDY